VDTKDQGTRAGSSHREEMIRLGFWSNDALPEEELKQQAIEDEEYRRLSAELARLRNECAKLKDVNELIKEARKKRIAESQRKRAERKQKREQARAEASKRWQEYKKSHIIHAGEGYSAGLQSRESDVAKLKTYGLPVFADEMGLAEAMGLRLSQLKWLTYHRDTAAISHYHRFVIPKKKGGVRTISAPKTLLKQTQQWIKREILDKLEIHPAAHGFREGKSIVDNAKCHLGRAVVIKLDLKDFFPTITYRRVKGLFRSFGYSEAISTLLGILCTEPPRQEVLFDGKFYHVAIGERQLPQGAPTSPAITNLLCRRLDERLSQLAEKWGFCYTRYADDLTFSAANRGDKAVGMLIHFAGKIVTHEGFKVNEEKTRVLRSSNRQTVTGIVVNEKPNINRKEWKAFRALLHNVEKNGLEKENRQHHPRFWDYIKGRASYIRMVRPDLEGKLAGYLVAIGRKHKVNVPKWAIEKTLVR
jgi:RNA-directed DNA polymerase